jgi:hypothetical protein
VVVSSHTQSELSQEKMGRQMRRLRFGVRSSLCRPYSYLRAGAVVAVLALPAQIARADEGGVSFWIPGFFGTSQLSSRPRDGP